MENDWVSPEAILGAMSVGVYVCDRDRRIVYWSKKAQAITGWRPDDVMGHSCRDNILNHIDKDGRPLCGEESCPLHRTMVTGQEADCADHRLCAGQRRPAHPHAGECGAVAQPCWRGHRRCGDLPGPDAGDARFAPRPPDPAAPPRRHPAAGPRGCASRPSIAPWT